MKRSLARRAVVGLIRMYQRWISRWLGRRCRFHPTCSAYAIEAVERRGVVVGSLKAAWRVMRCNPFNAGGYDPVTSDERDPGRGEDGAEQDTRGR